MSNLEELIEKLCPDGVEYKEINDCTIKVQNIKWKSYVGEDKQYIDLSSVDRERNIITETQNINTDTAPSRAQQIVMKDDIIFGTTRPMLKRYCIIPEKYDGEICSTGFCVLRAKTDIINPRWLYHNITTNNFFAYVEKNQQGASYPAISDTIVKAFKLPVPPLEVQREIVRILDNFTFLTTELAAELAARQKQYEYYRDLLFLSLKAEYRFIPEFAKTYIGLVTTMTQHYVKEGVKLLFNSSVKENHFDFPKMVYLDNEFAEKNSSRMHKLGDIITVHTGDVGTSAIIDETLEGSLGFATIVTRIYNQEDVLPKYVSYYLNSNENKNNIYKLIKGDRNNLNLKDFNKLRVPIPSLEQQQRIVDILDRFDTLCNDITSGLPAEIEMRQKQYEYYRDKLLTFKELKKEA